MTMANVPSDRDRMAIHIRLILVSEKQKYFCFGDWTFRANQCRRRAAPPSRTTTQRSENDGGSDHGAWLARARFAD
jgi:hypothetical protein